MCTIFTYFYKKKVQKIIFNHKTFFFKKKKVQFKQYFK